MPELTARILDKEQQVATYPFLTDEWLDAARQIRDEQSEIPPPPAQAVRINLVVAEVPFSDLSVDAHLDTSSGAIDIEIGHIEESHLTVTIDYETAKALLVDGNVQAAMQAMLGGKIKFDGDISKLLQLQTFLASGDAISAEFSRRIREITT
jgi:hypothetical protein